MWDRQSKMCIPNPISLIINTQWTHINIMVIISKRDKVQMYVYCRIIWCQMCQMWNRQFQLCIPTEFLIGSSLHMNIPSIYISHEKIRPNYCRVNTNVYLVSNVGWTQFFSLFFFFSISQIKLYHHHMNSWTLHLQYIGHWQMRQYCMDMCACIWLVSAVG